MANMYLYPIPAVGTKGIYTLTSPFSTDPGEVLECDGIRTLSAYIANNDDALQTVYLDNKLTEDDYNADLAINIEVVTLVNSKGFRRLVPAKYIASYPVQDGVFYRALTVGLALPLMPVEQDIRPVMLEIQDLVKARLGVASKTTLIQATDPRAFTHTQDDTVQGQRRMLMEGDGTQFATIAKQQRYIEELQARLRALELWVIDNHP